MSKNKRVKVVDREAKLPTDKPNNPVMTMDSFQNAMARLGFNMPNMLEATKYPLTRLTQDYQTLNSLYRNHWIVRKIVDVIPEDMCKNWIKLNTQIDPGSMTRLEKVVRKTKTKERILEGLKWGRLYGGAVGVILIEGQEDMLTQPLNYDLIMPGSYKGLLILDRWSGISPEAKVISDINDPDFGLPAYYQMTMPNGQMLRVHHSRVLRFIGNALPLWESWAEQQWGASVVESVYDELKKRDNTSYNIANLVFLANLRIYKTNMLDLLSLGDPKMQQDFYSTVQAINMTMSNSGMTVIGQDEEFDTKQYTFTGLNDVYESFMLDVAGACEIPVTRLFGRSPAGFNATGESDLTNYYDSIEEKQEAYLSPVLDKLLPIIALSTWGMIPDDLDYEYNPLRKADPKENADLAKSMGEAVVSIYNASLISQQTALKELRQQSEITGMWSNITDEDIAKADAEVDMGGELDGVAGMLPDFKQPSLRRAADAEWHEEDHPRRKDGKFGEGGGSSKPVNTVKGETDIWEHIQVSGIDEAADQDIIEYIDNEWKAIPQKHRDILKDLSGIMIDTSGRCFYSPNEGTVYLDKDVMRDEPGVLIHEMAHALEEKLGLYENEQFLNMMKRNIGELTFRDIQYLPDDFNEGIALAKDNGKYVSEYQRRVYLYTGTYDDDGKFNYASMREYFSEGYKVYLLHGEKLKRVNGDLYDFIKKLV